MHPTAGKIIFKGNIQLRWNWNYSICDADFFCKISKWQKMVPSKLWMNSILKEYAVQKYEYWLKVVIKHPISKHQPTNFELSREKRGNNVCLGNVCLCTLYLTETANGQKVCQSFEYANNFRNMQELNTAFRRWMEQVQILNPFCMQTAFTISTNWNKNGCAVLCFKTVLLLRQPALPTVEEEI